MFNIQNTIPILKNLYCNSRLPYKYENMGDVLQDTVEWCKTISSNFDTVIALPRSGLIMGSVISTYFGKPLSTPDLIITGKRWVSGQSKIHETNLDFYHTVLLVDDFVWTGKQLFSAKTLLQNLLPNTKIITAALYVNKDLTESVDLYYKTTPNECLMHWDYNIMHGKPGKIAFDLDGVLCFDWDNHSDYEIFLKTAKPFRIPMYEIDLIVTARCEKYRGITEKWLIDHNVKYKKLYMISDTTIDCVKFKSKILLKENPALYVESDPCFADAIRKETGLRVICIGKSR